MGVLGITTTRAVRPGQVGARARRFTTLDGAMLGGLALVVATSIVSALAHRGWVTAALGDALAAVYLLALTFRAEWRPLLIRLFLFGLIAGALELFTDAAGESFARSLIYPPGEPLLWASPIYMPLSWGVVLTQLGYLAWRLAGLMRLRTAMLLCGLWAGANIPYYEEAAFHAGWWHYAPAPGLGHTPFYVIVFEALIGASLPLLLRAVERRSWPVVAALGVAAGLWMPWAALVAWLAIGR